MAEIVGLAEWHDDVEKMRKSVFLSRTHNHWSIIDRMRLREELTGWCDPDHPFDYYRASWPLRDDEFGMKLYDTLSFHTIDFSGGVAEDPCLDEEIGCRRSVFFRKAGDVIKIWYKALDEADLDRLVEDGLCFKRVFTQRGYRRNVEVLGRAIGVDSMMRAWAEGVPFDDIMA